MKHIHLNGSSAKGFTLIELLVVISIISMLASVVLAGLKNARQKSQDAAVKQEALQLRNLFEIQKLADYSPTYSYLNSGGTLAFGDFTRPGGLGWVFGASANCPTANTQAQQLCQEIFAKNNDGANSLIIGAFGPTGITVSYTTQYSITVRLPSTQKYFCVGSSGRTSDNVDITDPFNAGGAAQSPGCMGNP